MNETSTLPIARIDTMDAPYVLPLREYFHTNGCQVFVNTGPTENVTYYVVVGDDDFVKRTLAFRHDFGKKQYIICWSVGDKEALLSFLSPKSKIAFIDPKPLGEHLLTELFSFFFIGKHRELDLTTPVSIHKNIEKPLVEIPEELLREKTTPTLTKKEQEQKRIRDTIADVFDLPVKKSEPEKKSEDNYLVHTQSKTHIKNIVLLAGITLLIIASPWICFFAATTLRIWSLKGELSCFKKGNASCMKTELKHQETWRAYQELPLPIIIATLSFLGKEKAVTSLERMLFLLDTSMEIEKELITIGDSGSNILTSFFNTQATSDGPSPLIAIDTLRKSIPVLKTQLDIAYATLAALQTDPLFAHPILQHNIILIEEKLKTLRQVGEIGEQIAQLYPYFSGFKDKQDILILLQNNSELRPTGGFIGSLAHITISDGVLDRMSVEDVYALDGQLKGHIDPPGAIRTVLNQEHWYLRDSNWDPDFSKSAAQARWFYEKEGGGNVDTVIGVTASFFVKLLAILGPVDLPQYNDRISADNFYAKSLYYIHSNFFPGSTNKKDFLGTLLEALMTKAQQNAQTTGIAVLEALSDAILSHDIQWYTMKQDAQAILERFGWAGIVPSHTTCPVITEKTPCAFLYLHINEANLGVNKVNIFIKRTQNRTISINEQGEIAETVTRRIQNTAGSEIGGGAYTVVTRFFIPENARITTLTLDGVMLLEKSAKTPLPYYTLDLPANALLPVAVSFVVEQGKERVLTLSYTHASPIVFGEGGAIVTVFEQKQAGVDEVPTTTDISYPSYWKATILTGNPEGVVANQGKLKYNNTLTKDSEHAFLFTQ